MGKNNDAKNEANKQPKPLGVWRWLLPLLIVISGAIVAIAAYRWLIHQSQFLGPNTDPTQYVTGNLLNVLIILAVVLQAIIYLRMATQNERLIKASEDSAGVAREAFQAGERAYFGILDIEPINLGPDPDRFPGLKIDFQNGGKTPAWRIHTSVFFGLGADPDHCDRFPLRLQWPNMRDTFMPAGLPHAFEYTQSKPVFKYDADRMKRVANDEVFLFVIAKIHYRDFRRVWHSQVFRALYQPHGEAHFCDYDATERDCKVCEKEKEAN